MRLSVKKAVVEVCGSCNYKCAMCPQAFDGGRERSFKKLMDFQMFCNILDELNDNNEYVPEIYLEGSGEPTMNKKLPKYIEAGVERGFKMSFITNGSLMTGQHMRDIIDAGTHFARFSVIGYNKEKYSHWMKNKFVDMEMIVDHANETISYIQESKSSATIGSYSLITDNSQIDYEVSEYRVNFIDKVKGIKSSIWKMHNWSGQLDVNWRQGAKKRSCGRPFSPDLIVRAGGNDGKQGAVVPCCMVLGQDSKAVLGHLSEQSIEEIWYGEKYENLRQMHREHRFDEIDYCKDCDMLYDTPEALVWSNYEEADYSNMTGSTENMINLAEYRI